MFRRLKQLLRHFLVDFQRYTHLDNIYLAKGGFWTTLQFVASTVTSIATVIAFGNLLPRETYGIYKYLLSLAGTFGFLTLTGMNTAVVRAVARDQAGILPYAVRLQIRYNLAATVVMGGLAAYYAIQGNTVFAVSLGVLALSFPLTAAYNTYTAALMGKKRLDLLAVTTTLSSIAAAAAVIAALFLTDDVALLIATYAAATLVPNILAYWYVRRMMPPGTPTPEAVSELRQTGFHLTAISIIGTLAQYLDKIILFQVAGPAALAVYGFALAGPDRLKGLLKNWVSISLPRLSESSVGEIRAVFYKRVLLSFVPGMLFAGAFILLSPLLFGWVLPRYLDAIRYSQVYALSLILLPASAYFGNVLYGQNMLRAVYIYTIGFQVVRIILFAVLGWYWHAWGLIAAFLISQVIGFLYGIVIWEVESRKMMKAKSV